MDEKDRSKLYLERLLGHQDRAREGKSYGIKRLDLLIISISGAGIYVIFETLRFFKQQTVTQDLTALKAAGISFTLAIVVNFFSQWTGYSANEKEIKSTELEISKEKGDSINDDELKAINKSVQFYNKSTDGLNITSTILMLLGIVMLTVFNLFIS